MPVPQIGQFEISQAIDKVLEETGITPRDRAMRALVENQLDIEDAIVHIANIINCGKDNVKLRAIEHVLAMHGIELNKPQVQLGSGPIQFNIHASGDCSINSLFAPER